MKLLIADDEDMIRKGLAKYIELHTDRFEKVLMASDGQEACDLIFRDKPELMLLDVQMPAKDGIEVMQEANQAGILPATIILSGYDEFRYAQQAVRCGAKDYLLKPSRSSDILKKLNEVADECFGREEVDLIVDDTMKNSAVAVARRYMDEYYYENLTLGMVADKVGITAGYLSTLFTRTDGVGFIDYLNSIRIKHACSYLMQNYLKTYEIAYKVGYNDEKYFSKVFHKVTGQTPSEYRKKHRMAMK